LESKTINSDFPAACLGPSRTVPGLFHAFGFCGQDFSSAPGLGRAERTTNCRGELSDADPRRSFGIERFEGEVATDEKFLSEFDATA